MAYSNSFQTQTIGWRRERRKLSTCAQFLLILTSPAAMIANLLGHFFFNSIIALHGLGAQSPKTWIAWKVNGDKNSGDVNWLRDDHMLPHHTPNARILTYDWNANYDEDASGDIFLGHADGLLDRLRVDRNKLVRLISCPLLFNRRVT